MIKPIRAFGHALLLVAAGALAQPAAADLSAFVSYVGFDDAANLDSSPGIGLRWGKSSGIFGGETSLMVCDPAAWVDEKLAGTKVSSDAAGAIPAPAP